MLLIPLKRKILFEKQLNTVWIRSRIWIRNRNFSNVGTGTAINRYCSTTQHTLRGNRNTGTSWSPFHLMRKKSSPGSLVAPTIGAPDYEHDRWRLKGYIIDWFHSLFGIPGFHFDQCITIRIRNQDPDPGRQEESSTKKGDTSKIFFLESARLFLELESLQIKIISNFYLV